MLICIILMSTSLLLFHTSCHDFRDCTFLILCVCVWGRGWRGVGGGGVEVAVGWQGGGGAVRTMIHEMGSG